MAFTKEVPTREEVKRFDLNNLWDKYCSLSRASFDDINPYYFEAIIDRDREIYFFPFEQELLEEDTISSIYQYLLVYKGESIFIKVKENNIGLLGTRTYTVAWDLISIEPEETKKLNNFQILVLIKEALDVEENDFVPGGKVDIYKFKYNF